MGSEGSPGLSASPSAPGSPVDLEAALAWVDGDRVLLEELLAVFREECPVQLRALRAAVEAADGPLVRRLAHTVKGSVASLGAARARDLAETLEHLGQAGTLDRAPGALAGLEAELARVLACLAGPRPGTGA